MNILSIKLILTIILLIGGEVRSSFTQGSPTVDLPAGCSTLQVPPGNRPVYRVYAIGVQIYRWNGTSWDFVAPQASLFADENFNFKVGTHYAGPTWESRSGSKVAASRVSGCSPDANAIPWLLLKSVSTDGYGIFRDVSYIHRVNTSGGLAPSTPGPSVGAEARVPYTTEYFFYQAEEQGV